MGDNACSDTGPILHLQEINEISLLAIFPKVYVSTYIKDELLKYKIGNLPKNFKLKDVNKDQVALLSEKYSIDIGESSVIWLCKSLEIPLLLTDDLATREVALYLGIKPVGAIGIIMRCFKDRTITQKKAIELLKDIHTISSLFITSQLINYAINEIKKFKKKH